MCQQNKKIKRLSTITTSQEEQILKDGIKIISQTQNILSMEDAFQLKLIEKEKYMKTIQAQAKLGITNIVSKVMVEFHDTVEKFVYVDTSKNGMADSNIFIKVPLRLEYKDSWNLFKGVLVSNGFFIDSIITKNDLRFTLGYKKQGFFKKPKPIVEIKSSNPTANIVIKENVIIKEPKPFYKKTWFGVLVGIGGTLLLL